MPSVVKCRVAVGKTAAGAFPTPIQKFAVAGCLAVVLLSLLSGSGSAYPQERVAAASLREMEATPDIQPIWKGQRDIGINDVDMIKRLVLEGDRYAIAVQAARAFVKDHEWSKAIAQFEQAARLRPVDMPFDELGDTLAETGDLDGAINAYRQIVYREGRQLAAQGASSDKPFRDWTDTDGSSVRAKVAATSRRPYISSTAMQPAVLMQYTLLLLSASRYDEARQAYRWGYEASFPYRPRFEEMYELFASEDMAKTDTAQNRNRMKAAAHIVIGLTYKPRSRREAVLPPSRTVFEMNEALKLDPDMTAAYAFLGTAMYKMDSFGPSFKILAREAWNLAASSSEPLVSAAGRESIRLRYEANGGTHR